MAKINSKKWANQSVNGKPAPFHFATGGRHRLPQSLYKISQMIGKRNKGWPDNDC